jgi:hypothetical protein
VNEEEDEDDGANNFKNDFVDGDDVNKLIDGKGEIHDAVVVVVRITATKSKKK